MDEREADRRHMLAALALARRGLGRVWPNPAVGCVIAGNDGRVLGRGWTQPGGRPHAEVEALRRAGPASRGATAYVSLEPCAHHGQTGPCADALVEAGIARVVIGTDDPDGRVRGRGIRRLRDAGVEVTEGVCRADADRLNAGFLMRVTKGRPLVTVKVASTLDGRIATRSGDSQWITGETARHWGHALRASHDVIMIGSSTARLDDPSLDCRLPGMGDRSPLRVVMDSRLAIPLTAKILATASQRPTWIVTSSEADQTRRDAIAELGVEIIEVPADDGGRVDAGLALAALAERGITRVLVEGGATLTATLLRAGLVDRLAWFRAPDVIGGDGLPAAQGFGVDRLSEKGTFSRSRTLACGRDVLEIYDHVPAVDAAEQ